MQQHNVGNLNQQHTMKRTGIALIGAGNIGQSIHLPILSKLPGVEIVAICDRNKSTAKLIAEKYGIKHVCTEVSELLKLDGIDAVDICTSTDTHYEVAVECLEAGKDALIEKPLARSWQEAAMIGETATRCERKVMVAMNHRFRPDTITLKSIIERGELGKFQYIKSGWLKQRSSEQKWLAQADRSGGGVMLDLGIVLIDLMLWLTNFPKVHSVRAVMQKHQTKNVEDFVTGFLNFADDTVAIFETSWTLQRPEELYYCNFFGEQGSAYINPLKIIRRQGNEFVSTETPDANRSKAALYQKSYQNELQHFVNAVQGLVPVASTVGEAVHRMRIIDSLYVSARERTEILLDA
jgi:predicted dehydrogenase